MAAVLSAKQELVLRPGTDIDKYKKLVLNAKSGRTDHKLVRSILMEVAEIYGVASDFGKYDKGRMIRRRLVEVVDSTTDLQVKKVRKSPKLTSGKVDKGMVTEEAFGELVSKVDDLATAMALLAKVIADKS
jgi:hypothetical protein